MKISEEKKEKISEQILAFLFLNSPKLIFTSHVAREVARDEEFIKDLLESLKKKGFVSKVTKNSQGINYKKRARWKLTNEAYDAYRKSASNHNLNLN